jgi:hypothetical protein
MQACLNAAALCLMQPLIDEAALGLLVVAQSVFGLVS